MSLRSSIRGRAAASLLVLFGSSLGLAGTARAAVPVDVLATAANGRIAFVASGPSTIPFGPPEQTDIWVMNPDGTGRSNLTDSTDVDDMSPAWSPDGTRIAYISDSFLSTLMVMNADGSGKTAVIDGASAPSWGPDGTKVAVLRGGESGLDVVIVDVSSGDETIVTGPDARPAMDPAWSPDGTKIAFVSVRPETYPDLITGEPLEGAQYEIVVVNVDGSGEVVVSAGEPGSDHATFLEEDRAPSWSPDSRMLVFMSQGQIPSCCGPWQLFAVNADGTGLTDLSADDTLNDEFPSWSPDGTTIVFSRAIGDQSNLYTIPAPTELPLPPAAAVAGLRAGVLAVPAATPITTDGNAQDPAWGRSPAARVRLTVTLQTVGGATGRVTSAPAGISCGNDCTERYAVGTLVTLTATPGKGSTFVRWSGACAGASRTCTVELAAASRVTARFRQR